MAKQSTPDFELTISSAQVLGTTAALGTNEIDLGSTGMGEGKAIKLVLNVTALSGTLLVKACSKTSATVAATDNPVSLSTISTTGQYHFTLSQAVNRYFNLSYTAATSATVTAWLTAAV